MAKHKKNAQVTIFILLAIMIIVITLFLVFIRGKLTKKGVETEVKSTAEMPDNVREVETYITSCLDNIAEDALELAGKQGGYVYISNFGPMNIQEPADYLDKDIEQEKIPKFGNKMYLIRNILYYDSGLKMPNIELPKIIGDNGMENMLKVYTETRLKNDCLGNIGNINYIKEKFENRGLNIDALSEPTVSFNLAYPLKITDKKNNDEYSLTSFTSNKNIRFEKIFDFIKAYHNYIEDEWEISNNLDDLPLPSEFKIKSNRQDFADFDITEYLEEQGILVEIKDTNPKTSLGGEQYVFWFMIESPKLMKVLSLIDNAIDSNGKFDKMIDNLPDYIGYICIVGSDEKSLPIYYNDKDKNPEFVQIYKDVNEPNYENNIYFVTKQLVTDKKMEDITNNINGCSSNTQGASCGYHIAYASKLGSNVVLSPFPLICYQNNKNVKLKGKYEQKYLKFSDDKGDNFIITKDMIVDNKFTLSPDERDGYYFYKGFVVNIVQSLMNKIQSIDLEYNYNEDEPLKIKVERIPNEPVKNQGTIFSIDIPSSDDTCKKVGKLKLPEKKKTSDVIDCNFNENIITFPGCTQNDDLENIKIRIKSKENTEKDISKGSKGDCGDLELTKDEFNKDNEDKIIECKYKYTTTFKEQTIELNAKCEDGLAKYEITEI